MEIKGEKFGEGYYKELNECISDQWQCNTESKVAAILEEFRIKDIEKVLIMLIDDREKLVHEIVTNKGLVVTDVKPFEIIERFRKHVGEKDFNLMVNDPISLDEDFTDWIDTVTWELK